VGIAITQQRPRNRDLTPPSHFVFAGVENRYTLLYGNWAISAMYEALIEAPRRIKIEVEIRRQIESAVRG